jgi:hypothetical protein
VAMFKKNIYTIDRIYFTAPRDVSGTLKLAVQIACVQPIVLFGVTMLVHGRASSYASAGGIFLKIHKFIHTI